MGSIKTRSKQIRYGQTQWHGKKRALAVAVASVLSAGPALAQNGGQAGDSSTMEEVVVKGLRGNLMNAQDLKYNADTVVDSITAEDLGSFPDKSIAEALQRVAGVTVNRFAASSDTAHFSAEPSGVIVRGLNQVRTEFNGRDSFSANSSRGLSWTDVSPELMSRVDTYKNQMAELIEGGIAGTVDMHTRMPFDQDGMMFAASVDANYGDLSEEWTPEASALFSNRWAAPGGGEFGVMANLAYSEVKTRSEGIQEYRIARYQDVYGPDTFYYIPSSIFFRDNLYERERNGQSLAFQWANADDTKLFSAQYNRSEYEQSWEEYVVQAATPGDDAVIGYSQSVYFVVDGNRPFVASDGTVTYPNNMNSRTQETVPPVPLPGTEFTFDSRGLFQSGVMTHGVGWWGNNNTEAANVAQNAAGQNMVNACYDWNGCSPNLRGMDLGTITRSNNNNNVTQDLGLNYKWDLSDTVRSNFDLQLVKSEVQNYDIEVNFWTFANTAVDMSGEHPRVEFQDPLNVNQSPGGLTNPNNYYIRSIMDHLEDSDGEEVAFRTDFEFDIPSSDWMESVKVGARFANRDQNVRWASYNWQNVANTWTGNQWPYWNLDRHDPANGAGSQPGFTGYPEGYYVERSFRDDFFDGNNLTPNSYIFANVDMMKDQQLWANSMSASALGFTGGTGWDPICSNTGDRAGETPGTCYTPSEVADVTEKTQALYVQLNFGGEGAELFNVPVSGNLGVRYVKTNDESKGGVAFPQFSAENLTCESTDDGDPATPAPPVPNTVGCYLAQEDIDFANGASELNTADVDHENWLPSFNIKFELTDEWLARFAASRAMARPDIGNLRNYVGMGVVLPNTNNSNDPLWVKDGSGNIVGADVKYTANAQNPYLAPIVADQYDLSLEYYFADVGSFTVTLFDKQFDDYIQFSRQNLQYTNNGSTQVVEVSRPLNGEGASINGYELSYQTFFDFLPGFLSDFGVQLNYTHINNNGITNSNIQNTGGNGTVITGQAPNQIAVNSLEGLSDDSYTAILMYENDAISARLAYSWRSEYLVTVVDCCVAYPVWNDDYGQVDGSIAWHINDSWELHLQGSNLTDEETRTSQQTADSEDGRLLFPTGYFHNDRRYTIGFRYRY